MTSQQEEIPWCRDSVEEIFLVPKEFAEFPLGFVVDAGQTNCILLFKIMMLY